METFVPWGLLLLLSSRGMGVAAAEARGGAGSLRAAHGGASSSELHAVPLGGVVDQPKWEMIGGHPPSATPARPSPDAPGARVGVNSWQTPDGKIWFFGGRIIICATAGKQD